MVKKYPFGILCICSVHHTVSSCNPVRNKAFLRILLLAHSFMEQFCCCIPTVQGIPLYRGQCRFHIFSDAAVSESGQGKILRNPVSCLPDGSLYPKCQVITKAEDSRMMSGSVMGKVFFHLPVCLLFLPGDRCILPGFSLSPVQDIFFLQG